MIVVDSREQKLLKLFQSDAGKDDIVISSNNLDIGDIILENNNGNKIIFERKTCLDLESSIIDGRYREQKIRLDSFCADLGISKWFYIFEGFNNDFDSLSDKVKGAIINSTIRDNIHIFFTNDVKDTKQLIVNIYKRFMLNTNSFLQGKKPCYDAVLCNNIKKNKNITKENIFIQQLCLIPGISFKKATSIIEFSNTLTLYELVDKLKNNDNFLDSCPGIGKMLANKILSFIT